MMLSVDNDDDRKVLNHTARHGPHMIWQGGKKEVLYFSDGRRMNVKRYLWTKLHKEEPPVQLVNFCGVKNCVSPEHLERRKKERVTQDIYTCTACERKLRPRGKTLEEYPDTIMTAGKSKCESCRYSTVEPLDPTLIVHVKKLVPEDLWEYFGVAA